MKVLFILAISICITLAVFAQDAEAGQQQEINRETIEAIMNNVSPGCRNEMESAIQSQTEVTPDCKFEIQQAVRRFH